MSIQPIPTVKTFADSQYKALSDKLLKRTSQEEGNEPIRIEELWKSAKSLVAHYEKKPVAERFIEELEIYIKERCCEQDYDEDDVKTIAVLLWAASKFGGVRSELCSLLNRAIREDSGCPVLEDAVLLARAINLNLVAPYLEESPTRLAKKTNFKEWPSGPVVDQISGGWSSNKNTTWRGGGMPLADLEWYLDLKKQSKAQNPHARKFRTKMFVATSFSKSVAGEFSERAYNKHDPSGTGKVLFRFNFEEYNCLHVNYLDKSMFPQEKEFLLPPYTALELEEVRPSNDLDHKAHVITVKVLPDNQAESNGLPLAPRI